MLFSLSYVASEMICIHRRYIGITLFSLVCACCVRYFVISIFAAIPPLVVGVSRFGLLVFDTLQQYPIIFYVVILLLDKVQRVPGLSRG